MTSQKNIVILTSRRRLQPWRPSCCAARTLAAPLRRPHRCRDQQIGADAGGLKFAQEQGIATGCLITRPSRSRQPDAALAEPDRPLRAFNWWCWPASCVSSRRSSWRAMQAACSTFTLAAAGLSGLHTHQRALDAGCQFAGATVHIVTADLDHGPILGAGRGARAAGRHRRYARCAC